MSHALGHPEKAGQAATKCTQDPAGRSIQAPDCQPGSTEFPYFCHQTSTPKPLRSTGSPLVSQNAYSGESRTCGYRSSSGLKELLPKHRLAGSWLLHCQASTLLAMMDP